MALLLVPVIGAWSALRERMATAMFAIAAAFGLLMLSQHLRGGDSIAWLVGWYALGTLGEALISPARHGPRYVVSPSPLRASCDVVVAVVDVSRRLSCRARIGAHRGFDGCCVRRRCGLVLGV